LWYFFPEFSQSADGERDETGDSENQEIDFKGNKRCKWQQMIKTRIWIGFIFIFALAYFVWTVKKTKKTYYGVNEQVNTSSVAFWPNQGIDWRKQFACKKVSEQQQ